MYNMQLLVLALVTIGVVVGDSIAPTCMAARNRCVSRIGCGMALNNFHIACESVKLGTVNQCTDACLRAVVALVTVDEDIGTDYLKCDCGGNQDCSQWMNRISMCTEDVMKALNTLDNEKVISCSLARMLCEADTKCWTALSIYEQKCSNLWIEHSENKLECSSKCNNSLSILYRQTRATKLKNCECDNTDPLIDENTCIRMKYNTATYCHKHEPERSFINVDTGNKSNYSPESGESKETVETYYDAPLNVIIGNTASSSDSSAAHLTVSSFSILGMLVSLLLLKATWCLQLSIFNKLSRTIVSRTCRLRFSAKKRVKAEEAEPATAHRKLISKHVNFLCAVWYILLISSAFMYGRYL